MNKTLPLTGTTLTIDAIYSFIKDPSMTVVIDKKTLSKLDSVRKFVDNSSKTQVIYGINTGFGPMASHIISKDRLGELQQNLIRSHAVGIGEPIKDEYVLAAMLVRLNTHLKGYSGVSRDLALQEMAFINNRIIPLVPEHGAVGTSGDLVQLAHIALALIGEGEVRYKDRIYKSVDIIKKLGLKPYTLLPKEGLALINGTSVMSGIASIICAETEQLLSLAIASGAWSLEMVNGFGDSISEKLHELRPHIGQVAVAKRMRDILATSHLIQDRHTFNKTQEITSEVHEIPVDVQDVYSLRCIPQILGPVYDALMTTKSIVEIEINSVTDNPIIDIEAATAPFLHGGNFHGDYIAYAIDQLKMTIVKLTMLSERRINYFLNSRINRKYPPFVNLDTPGLTLALQALQFVATSTTSQNQTLAFPQYVHSISTNADNQDVVSMGTDASLLTAKVLENAFIVQSIEFITLAQTVDFAHAQKKLSKTTLSLYSSIRKTFKPIIADRVLIDDLKLLTKQVRYHLYTLIKNS